jgi:hypothetical protein
LRDMHKWSDTKLQEQLQDTSLWWGDDVFQCALSEACRRGNTTVLKELHDRMEREGHDDWSVLTMLRRSEQRPDPVKVNVDIPSDQPPGTPGKVPEPPILAVSAENSDVDGRPFKFSERGTENHGRQEYVHVILTTEAGDLLPRSNFDVTYAISDFDDRTGSYPRLQKGQRTKEAYRVDLRKYLAPPPTGRYMLQVAIGDGIIADEISLDGYVICRSEPIPVRVENRMRPPRRGNSAVYPVFIVLAIAAVMLGFGFFQKLRRQAEKPEPLHRFVDWRGFAALAIAAVIACGWFMNIRSLEAEIERIRPDDEADWSITRVE